MVKISKKGTVFFLLTTLFCLCNSFSFNRHPHVSTKVNVAKSQFFQDKRMDSKSKEISTSYLKLPSASSPRSSTITTFLLNNHDYGVYRNKKRMILNSISEEDFPSDVDYNMKEILDTNSTEVSAKDIKQDLLLELIGTNRGFNIISEQKEDILNIISDLEMMNPTPYPTDLVNSYDTNNNLSPLVGDWRLIYTNAIDVLSLGILPTVILGRVYQNINNDLTEVTNIAEVSAGVSQLSSSPIFNKVFENVAELKVKAKSNILSNNRISLQFKSAKFVPNKIFGLDFESLTSSLPFSLPLPNVTFRGNNVQGYIDTTYVDKDIRVGRSPGKSVFVFVREKKERKSTSDE